MKKNLRYILIAAACAVIPLLIMLASYKVRLSNMSFDFTRKIIRPLVEYHSLNLKYNSYYIAGHSDNHVYLGNRSVYSHLLKVNDDLRHSQVVTIDIDSSEYHGKGAYTVKIDSPNFYMTNGVERSVLIGDLDIWKTRMHPIRRSYFIQYIPVGKPSAVYKIVSRNTKTNILTKESITEAPVINTKLLKKQVDGLFCTAGALEYNSYIHRLLYTYTFRNQILLIDTNLNLTKTIKTIDPIDSAKFKVSKISSSNSKVLGSNYLVVNAGSSSWKDRVFVHSRLMGNHEDDTKFKNSTVIDIYDLNSTKYLYSFYLPKIKREDVKDFIVIDNYLYTLSGEHITRYEFKLP